MSRRILLADQARLDLYEIWEYIAQTSPKSARHWTDKLHETFEMRSAMPQMGISQQHRRPNLRSWPVGSYLIFYRPLDDGIEVARVLHGSRDIDNQL